MLKIYIYGHKCYKKNGCLIGEVQGHHHYQSSYRSKHTKANDHTNEHTHYPSTIHPCSIPSWKIFMQVFEQEDEEKHLLSVGKYGAWNISRQEQVNGEGWLVS